MSEEKKVETKVEEVKEEKVEQPKEQLFNQEQVNNIIKSRLESEKAKYQRQLDEQKKAEEEVIKQKQIADAKTKADLEKLMQQRIAEKEAEIQKFKSEIKKEKIDNSLLSVASKNNAINPQQVVDLVKNQIRLSDDNRIEVLDNNNNIRYNQAGELLTIEEKVQEFLKANPHFSLSGKSGVGSQSSVEGKTVKPFNIQDLDMSKPEDRKRYAEYRKERDSRPTQINLTNK
jgi:hypothetical protein|tara:strand:+ start:1117 stop:1806 length:690 start_codon:yes stop_codon:yes gene_type:complete